jgi:DNA-binding response OmpR family regulator
MTASWLVLASDGMADGFAGIDGSGASAVVGDSEAFQRALADARPRIVVCVRPPATDFDLRVVLAHRRRRPGMRVMFVNAADAAADRLDALAQGFDDAVPITLGGREIAARARWLATRATSDRSQLVLGDGLELDLSAHVLRRDGASLHLRPKELKLLELLATHPGRAYTRRQLLDRVWGPGHAADPRTVDVHVAWLRSKLERDPEHPARLVTVRGIGYRLDLATPSD